MLLLLMHLACVTRITCAFVPQKISSLFFLQQQQQQKKGNDVEVKEEGE